MNTSLSYIGVDTYLQNFSMNSSFDLFLAWVGTLSEVQFDTETNMTKTIVDRELRVLQFGSIDASQVYVIQWSFLNDVQKSQMKDVLERKNLLKIIHNADFDYQVMLNVGIVLEHVWCTMTMEKILYAGHGYDLTFFSLAETLVRRYHIDVSKEQQGNFSDNIINDEKLVYAATDVVHLGKLKNDQRAELVTEDLIQLAEGEYSENEALLAFADISYTGMGFDPEKWRENIDKAQPILDKASSELNAILLDPEWIDKGHELIVNARIPAENSQGFRPIKCSAVLAKPIFTINWNSPQQVVEIFKIIFPDLEKGSQLELRTYLQRSDPQAPQDIKPASKRFLDSYIKDLQPNLFSVIKLHLLKMVDNVEKAFLDNYKDQLIAGNFLYDTGSVMINWNSNDAKLAVFQWFDPEIKSTDHDTVMDHLHTHKFFKSYENYAFANSLLTKYGEKFVEDNVDMDGKVRTRFDTIKSTGRVSSSQPNMQQIPANRLPPDRQNDYRNCFTPGIPGWKIVGSDYASQELAIIASLSGDEVFIDALLTGKDLHSTCAELIYDEKWFNAAAERSGNYPKGDTSKVCGYYALKADGTKSQGKCDCPDHKKLRTGVKTLNFGLAYGMSEIALSADLDISKQEALEIMDLYFSSFPRIKGMLEALGYFGKMNGFIRTPKPLRRKRYFPYWRGEATSKTVMNAIIRASKNAPIQGCAADMTKIALIRLRRRINDANMRDWVKLFMQVHDQVDSICHPDIVDEWSPVVTYEMEEAAKLCLGNDLLKTDTEVSDLWKK